MAAVFCASGFIGSHVVEGKLTNGFRVRALALYLPGIISASIKVWSAFSDLLLEHA